MAHSEEFQRGLERLSMASAAVLLILSTACIHRHGSEMIAFATEGRLMVRGDCKTLGKGCAPLKPTEADVYASERYDSYRRSGFVTLQPHMQLRVVAPILQAGASADIVTAQDAPAAHPNEITLRASAGLLGYETALYSIEEDDHSGRVQMKLINITVQPIGKRNDTDLAQTNYLRSITKPAFLRLYFQLRHAPASHQQVLLIADSQGELNQASGQFEPAPDAYCSASHAHAQCIVFPGLTAVNAEIRVFVKKHAVYVPLSATLKDAMVAAGVPDPQSKISRLRIRRYWDGHNAPVTFDRFNTPILHLTLAGDDRISF